MDDVPIGDCRVALVSDYREIERGLETGLVKAGKHHAGISTFKLRDRVLPPRRLAQIESAQTGGELAGKLQMQTDDAFRHWLGKSETRHFIWLVIRYLRGQSLVCGDCFRQGDFQSQRIQHDLACRLLYLYRDCLFAGKLLRGDVRVQRQLVISGDNGGGQALRLETGGCDREKDKY